MSKRASNERTLVEASASELGSPRRMNTMGWFQSFSMICSSACGDHSLQSVLVEFPLTILPHLSLSADLQLDCLCREERFRELEAFPVFVCPGGLAVWDQVSRPGLSCSSGGL